MIDRAWYRALLLAVRQIHRTRLARSTRRRVTGRWS